MSGNTPGPSQFNDKFSRVVRNNLANMRTLFGRAPVDDRTSKMTMPSDLAPAPQSVVWMNEDRAERNRTLTPEQVFTRTYGSGAATLPYRIQTGNWDPIAPLGEGRTLTPEQRRAAIAGAGSSAPDIESSGAVDFMAEWYRMTPDQRFAAYSGAGSVASGYEVMDDIAAGRLALSENEDGSSRLVPVTDLVSESDRRAAETVGYVSPGLRFATNQMLKRQYGMDLNDPATNPEVAWQWLADNYPSVAQAAALAGLGKQDVADVNRALKVKEVAENATALVAEGMPGAEFAARQMIAALPTETDRVLAQSFLQDMYDTAMASAQDAEDRGENWWSIGGRVLWGLSAGPILNALMLGNEAAVQFATAGLNAFYDAGDMLSEGDFAGAAVTAGTQIVAPVSVLFNGRYDDATRGNMDQEYINELATEYGQRAQDMGMSAEQGSYAVQVAVEVYQAVQKNDGEVLDTVLNKYRNDPVAWQIIQQGMLTPEAGGDTWFSDLYTRVSYGDRGNLGSGVVRETGMDPTWALSTLTRDAFNITAMLTLDPTLAGGKIVGAVRAARYGMFLLSDTTSISRAFSKSGTQNWFNWYGSQVKAIDELHAAGKHSEAGQRTTTLLSQSKRYANTSTLELFRKHRIYTADEARDFLLGMEAVETVITGRTAGIVMKVRGKWGPRKGQTKNVQAKPRDITEVRWADDEVARDAFALAASFDAAQSARRSWQRMTPHQTMAANWAKNASRIIRSGGDLTRLAARSTPVMDELLGPDFATLSRGQQTERLSLIFADDAKVDRLAVELSDFVTVVDEFGNLSGRRTAAGRIVDSIVRDPARRRALGLSKYGWKKKGVDTGEGILRSIGLAADRLSRHWSRMPDTRGGLITADASHADKVYQMMRYAGVNRSAASEFRDAWISMTQAEREIASSGLFRTFAKASGMDFVDETELEKLLKVGSGSSARNTEQYAAVSTDRFAGIINDADAEARAIWKAEKENVGREYSVVTQGGEESSTLGGASGFVPASTKAKSGTFPGNWKSDPDNFPVAHMDVPSGLRTSHVGYMEGKAWADDLDNVTYDSVRVDSQKMQQIADDYDALPLYDDAAVPSFEAMQRETLEQYEYLTETLGIKVVVVDSDPYESIGQMVRDVVENKTIKVLSTKKTGGHPFFTDEVNDKFRAVHDYFGHAATGRGFDRHGEEAAWIAHSRMFSPEARPAMTTETRGQNAFLNTRGDFGPQKVALISQEFVDDADRLARLAFNNPVPAGMRSPISNVPRDYIAIRDAVRAEKLAEARAIDPTARQLPNGGTVYGAAWLAQTSDRVAMPNFAAFDQVMARRSFLNSFLFNNRAGSALTDAWTFGTLAGPRFQLRNGIEDMVMYGITGGKMGAYSEGRRMSTVIRGATGRYDKKTADLRVQIKDTERKIKELEINSPESRSLPDMRNRLSVLQKEMKQHEAMGARQAKLGIINTMRLGLATRAGVGAREGSLRARFAGAMWKNFTTPQERLAAMKEGREAIVALQKRSLARERLLLIKDPEARAIPYRLKRGANIEDLSPRQQQMLRDMDDFLDSPHGREYEEMAMETSRHLADSTMPVMDDMAPVYKVKDESGRAHWYRRTTINREYTYQRVNGSAATIQQAEGMMFTLNAILTDGPRGQAVMARLEDYFNAYARAGSPDYAAMGKIIDQTVDYVRTTDMWHVYRERFRLLTPEDARDFVERAFRTAADAFTTPQGKFNRKLWSALDGRTSRVKVDGEFRIVNEAGDLVVAKEDFLPGGKFKPAYTVLVRNSDGLDVPVGTGFEALMDRGWAAMGRSLARMTREPIYKANYLDSRKALRPLEQAYARRFGEDAARKWATDQAAERAYQLTMNYVDNPAVRSVLAYRVRNISRFYRAVEDFGRRMYRTGRNNPMAFWRAALLWNATIDSGFTYRDEYGQEYFMYPLSRPGMEVLARVTSALGGGMQVQTLPMGISGQVQWLTPSADPDQWMPTLASPVASIIYRPILRSLPGLTALFGVDDEGNARFTEFGKNVDKAVFGTIGSEVRLAGPMDGYFGELANAIPQTLPPILNKLGLGVLPLLSGFEAPGSFASRIALRTALILESSGQGLSMEDAKDDVKLGEYARKVERTAVAVAFGMAFFGMMLPASPQIMDDQVTALGRDLEVTGMRTAFIKLMNNEIENGGDYWSAVAKWTENNPDLGIFTLSMKEASEYGYVDGLQGNADFARKYNSLFVQAPDALSMFAPNTGEATLKARRVLNMFDVRLDRDTESYAYELSGRNAMIQYWLDKKRYEADLESASSDEERSWLKNKVWPVQRQRHIAAAEGLEARLMDFEMTSTEEFADAVERARTVAQTIGSDGNGLGPMFLRVYNEYWAPAHADMESSRGDADFDEQREIIKAAWMQIVGREVAKDPDNEQWVQILETMTRGLEQAWSLPEG